MKAALAQTAAGKHKMQRAYQHICVMPVGIGLHGQHKMTKMVNKAFSRNAL